jgi:hypothetical protein
MLSWRKDHIFHTNPVVLTDTGVVASTRAVITKEGITVPIIVSDMIMGFVTMILRESTIMVMRKTNLTFTSVVVALALCGCSHASPDKVIEGDPSLSERIAQDAVVCSEPAYCGNNHHDKGRDGKE